MRVSPALPLRVSIAGLASLLALGTTPARAQEGSLRGIVVDTTGAPIRDVDVGIASQRRLSRTGAQGRFELQKLQPGEVEVSVRRLGFEPRKLRVLISGTGADSLAVTLKSSAAMLAAIDVSTTELRLRKSIEDFYRRSIQGTGQYVTRDQIEGRSSGAPSDMLRNTAGVRLIRSANGGYAVRFPNTSLSRSDCAPMMWVDGQPAAGMEIDDIPLRDLEGIEVYSGPSTTPMQFSSASSMKNCGTIVVWSRPPQYQRYPEHKKP
jgi:outer membrane receptor protein involved in Fe transport